MQCQIKNRHPFPAFVVTSRYTEKGGRVSFWVDVVATDKTNKSVHVDGGTYAHSVPDEPPESGNFIAREFLKINKRRGEESKSFVKQKTYRVCQQCMKIYAAQHDPVTVVTYYPAYIQRDTKFSYYFCTRHTADKQRDTEKEKEVGKEVDDLWRDGRKSKINCWRERRDAHFTSFFSAKFHVRQQSHCPKNCTTN